VRAAIRVIGVIIQHITATYWNTRKNVQRQNFQRTGINLCLIHPKNDVSEYFKVILDVITVRLELRSRHILQAKISITQTALILLRIPLYIPDANAQCSWSSIHRRRQHIAILALHWRPVELCQGKEGLALPLPPDEYFGQRAREHRRQNFLPL
jgi:hypothetical protein